MVWFDKKVRSNKVELWRGYPLVAHCQKESDMQFTVNWDFRTAAKDEEDVDLRDELDDLYKTGQPFTMYARSFSAALAKAEAMVKRRNLRGYVTSIVPESGIVLTPGMIPLPRKKSHSTMPSGRGGLV